MIIEELSQNDLLEAAHIYFTTVNMQNPPGNISADEAVQQLLLNFAFKKYKVLVSKSYNKIDGISIFQQSRDKLDLFFIGAYPMSAGRGTLLLNELKSYAIKQNVKSINTVVSSIDKKAVNFYSSFGFKKIGQMGKQEMSNLPQIKMILNFNLTNAQIPFKQQD